MPDKLHIIHLQHREDRLTILFDELRLQQIHARQIWEGITDNDYPARGILKAHQQIVAWAKQQGLPRVIIAEDDIKFSAKGAWRFYLDQIPGDFDLYLGGITWGSLSPDQTVADFSGTALYTVSNRFYDIFLSLQPGPDFDRQLARQGIFKVCHPFVVSQHDGYSDNSRRIMKFEGFTDQYSFFKG